MKIQTSVSRSLHRNIPEKLSWDGKDEITIADAAKLLGVCKFTIRKRINDYNLPTIRRKFAGSGAGKIFIVCNLKKLLSLRIIKSKNCLQCGNEYEIPKQASNRSLFCSTNCRSIYNNRHKGEKKKFRSRQETLKRQIANAKEKKCFFCGISFYSSIEKKKFCSRDCLRKSWSKLQSIQKTLGIIKNKNASLHSKNWRKNNPDKEKELRKKYYQDHKDEIQKKAKSKRSNAKVALCIVACQLCGKHFMPKRKGTAYCSPVCSRNGVRMGCPRTQKPHIFVGT